MKEKMKGNTMTKKTIVLLVGALLLALAVYAGGQRINAPTDDISIANAEVAETGICCLDCDGDCENCERCDGNCEDCDACDGNCEAHVEGSMCGGHVEGKGHKPGMCGGHGCGI
jgi:hypothetical protein